MPNDYDTIEDTYARVIQLRHSWDLNAKEMEEWKKQYLSEWVGEVRVARMKVTEEYMRDARLGMSFTGIWFDEFNCLNIAESDNEPKGWETL